MSGERPIDKFSEDLDRLLQRWVEKAGEHQPTVREMVASLQFAAFNLMCEVRDRYLKVKEGR